MEMRQLKMFCAVAECGSFTAAAEKVHTVQSNITMRIKELESELGKRDWFAGPEFTAADIQMSFPLEAAAARAPIVRQMPKLSAFLQRIHARPAYQRALERGSPYELMK